MEKDDILLGVQRADRASGREALIRHLNGLHNTPLHAIAAHCYDCTGFYRQGRESCEQPLCPLFPYMPYNPDKRNSYEYKKAV